MADIHRQYSNYGIDGYYTNFKNEYNNPHEQYVKGCLDQLELKGTIIDFCCGDGLVTKHLHQNKSLNFIGIDGFLSERYRKETGYECFTLKFKDMISNIPVVGNIAIASYCIDLIPYSMLNQIMWNLSQSVNKIVTIRPNKHTLPYSFLEEDFRYKCGKSNMIIYNCN